MRLRLVHQLALLMALTVLLAVGAMATLQVWNLRRGFSDYLRVQDGLVLDRLMVAAEADLGRLDGLPPRELRAFMHQWLERTAPQQDADPLGEDPAPRAPEARPAGPPDAQAPPAQLRRPRPPQALPPPPRPPRPPRDPARLGQRLVLLDAQGQWLAGRPEALQQAGQRRALKRQGVTQAYLFLADRSEVSDDIDGQFLRRQTLGIAAVAGLSLLVALSLALLLARRWLRPLQQAQQAARRMALGELAVRVPQDRADEIGALMRDLNAMAASLQQTETERRRWIAQLSHELRTPLAILRGELEALADGVRPWSAAALASLQDEVQRLHRLIEDFHLLAMSDLRRLPCQFEPVDVAALLRQAGQRVEERLRAKGLELQLDLDDSLGTARWDGERIAQLLGNLLENSLRYTDAPGRVLLRARRRGEEVQIVVEDSAPGLPPQQLRQLFDPLFRAEASRSRASGGSGLGLSIARALALSHGGRLHAEASALGGLAQCLSLPLVAGGGERA